MSVVKFSPRCKLWFLVGIRLFAPSVVMPSWALSVATHECAWVNGICFNTWVHQHCRWQECHTCRSLYILICRLMKFNAKEAYQKLLLLLHFRHKSWILLHAGHQEFERCIQHLGGVCSRDQAEIDAKSAQQGDTLMQPTRGERKDSRRNAHDECADRSLVPTKVEGSVGEDLQLLICTVLWVNTGKCLWKTRRQIVKC